MTLVAGGRPCRCPNLGCLEAYAGGWAITERAQEGIRHNPAAVETLVSLAGAVESITAVTVSQAYCDGDPLGCHLVEETGSYLAAGVTGIVNAFNSSLLILGGGVIEGMPVLVKTVAQTIKDRALNAAVEDLRVARASLVNNAGVIGAAAIARNELGKGD